MSEEREETERQKNIRRTQEATVYRVQQDFDKKFHTYRVTKLVIDEPVETYHVTLKVAPEGAGEEIFCDCPGFLRQKFEPSRHKHVRVVKDFVSRGSPKYADYRFVGAGRNTKIRFIKVWEGKEE